MPDHTAQPASDPQEQQAIRPDSADAWTIVIHNDDETPFDYVIHTLSSVFLLSDELADHIATTAHNSGTAVVAVRPRAEAQMLVRVALGRAKADGYPLNLTLKQK